MKIPKVGTKFLYHFSGNASFYIGVMYAKTRYKDIFISNKEHAITNSNIFVDDFIIDLHQQFKFISEVNSIEHAIELYPELFI